MTKDPSQNYIGLGEEPLKNFFLPKSVAVIGAKDDLGSVGRTLLLNLLSTYKGEIYPINPKRKTVLGKESFPNLKALPKTVDLAIIVTPAKTVPAIMKEIGDTGTKSVIIISAGFKETGEEGLALETEVLSIAREKGIRIIGPNCIGLMNPVTGLNATFAKGIASSGNLGFISQSGAMCTAVLDWSFEENIGFSAFVSIGSMCDVDWGDLIRYLGNDPNTRSILIYMETVGDPRSFLSAAREIALEKPIIIIKGGRSEQAAKAAASHTGSLAGSDEIFDAALERAGVLRVNTISELFDMASILAKQPLPKGPNLAIITNAGGPSVLATDAAVMNGAEIGAISKISLEKLDAFLPKAWSHGNPVDILGDADPKRYYMAAEVLSEDPLIDGILTILSPQDMTDPSGCAASLRHFLSERAKPLIASWMGGSSVKEGMSLLNESGIPTYNYPDDAAKSFATMWKYSSNLASLHEMPAAGANAALDTTQSEKQVNALIDVAVKERRTLLTEEESKKVLSAYDIPTVVTVIAYSSEEAVTSALKIGFPCVLKLFSKTITHKSDVGGVKLNLKSKEDVINAFDAIKASFEKADLGPFEGVTVQKMIKHGGYELILGSSTDPQFGKVILFGAGGELVEIFKDKAIGLPPLTLNLAKKLISKTKIAKAFPGFRGRGPVDIDELAKIVVRFSEMIAEIPRIKECDINPLIASEGSIIALDARVLLHEEKEDIPKTALRSYPRQYVKEAHLKDGTKVLLRPICPEDEPLIRAFHKELSENSVRQRYFEFLSLDKRIARERLIKICFNDFDRDLAIVAVVDGKIIGVGRVSRVGTRLLGNLTLIIQDAWHGKGLGGLLVSHLIHIAKEEKWLKMAASVLNENTGMIHILKENGFKGRDDVDVLTLTLDL